MECLHMSGAGNDFMIIDARGKEAELNFTQMALDLCAMTGADGFIAIGNSDIADFRMHFYNCDGSREEMCGNGSRCLCKFAYEHGIAGESMVIQTDAGLVPGKRLGENLYNVELNIPTVLDLNRHKDAAYLELGDPGLPHSVTEIPGLQWDMADELRPKALELRFNTVAFPRGGTNVNFYTWTGETSVRILTFERGVEDYTLACGTGSGSTAAILWTEGKLPGGKLAVQNKGGTLYVNVTGENGRITKLELEGPAEIVKAYEI